MFVSVLWNTSMYPYARVSIPSAVLPIASKAVLLISTALEFHTLTYNYSVMCFVPQDIIINPSAPLMLR